MKRTTAGIASISPLWSVCSFFLLTMVGCGPTSGGLSGVQIWAVPDWATIDRKAVPEQENEVYNAATRRIQLASAVNEVASFQLAVRGRQRTRIHGITADNLEGSQSSISTEHIRFYREARIEVDHYPTWYLRLTPYLRQKRYYPDVLIPLTAPRGALPMTVSAGECEGLWVEVHVPPGTSPGRYSSRLKITTAGDWSWGQAMESLDLAVDVWPFALPQSGHLAVLAAVDTRQLFRHHLEVNGQPYAPNRLGADDPSYPQASAILEATSVMLHEHQCTCVLRDVVPYRRLLDNAKMELDWSDYDRLTEGIIDGTMFEDHVAAPAWPFPLSDRYPPPESYGGRSSREYERVMGEYLAACAAHFQERGWFDRHFVWLPVGPSTQAGQYHQYESLGHIAQASAHGLRIVCPLSPQPMMPYGWVDDGFVDLSSLVSIWAPPASLADPKEFLKQQSAGRKTWLQPDHPPYSGSLSMIASAVDARSLAWQAYRFGCDAILLSATNDWSEDGVPRPDISERCLLWPGKPYGLDHPVPSIRLKRLMRGIQDYEYLWLLARNQRPGVARLVAEDLFPYGGTDAYVEHFLDGQANGWATEPSAWSLVLDLIGKEIVSALEQGKAGPPPDELAIIERFAEQIDWTRLIRTVRHTRMAVEGVRINTDQDKPGSQAVIEATVSIFNATRQPLGGRLALSRQPGDWVAEEVRLDPVAASRGTRRVMRIETPSVQPNADGVAPFRIGLIPDNGDELPADGRLCILSSLKLVRPLVIDGKLDDWPLGAGNVAGDFVLVGALDVPKRGGLSPNRPSQRTTVFVAHDAEYLYMAFNCEDDQLSERGLFRGNEVRYDELWPTGDDLVEVVLDPTNRAVHSGELFHIVVKANGAVVSQRGVPCLAQVAPFENWPADITAAVDDHPSRKRWIVEIRIPLASLGQRSHFCGINFGRFVPRLGEYSSWTGARRHLYSPVALGNMVLPQ